MNEASDLIRMEKVVIHRPDMNILLIMEVRGTCDAHSGDELNSSNAGCVNASSCIDESSNSQVSSASDQSGVEQFKDTDTVAGNPSKSITDTDILENSVSEAFSYDISMSEVTDNEEDVVEWDNTQDDDNDDNGAKIHELPDNPWY